jgi:uncharacterized membrane protein YhaH (DUF805 family)
MDGGIGLGDLLTLLAVGTAALCVVVAAVYATMLGVRRLFSRGKSASRAEP